MWYAYDVYLWFCVYRNMRERRSRKGTVVLGTARKKEVKEIPVPRQGNLLEGKRGRG
jgi:hypothetical protein